ncbi:MAG: PilN domain-containing protein [Myxococcota bacterium]
MAVRINLLPVRAAKRASSAKQELYAVAGVVFVAVAGVYLWSSSVSSDLEKTRREIAAVKRELKAIKEDRAKVDDYIKKNKTLRNKRDAIEKLQTLRTGPARMLDDLATILTSEKKVWLTELSENDGQLQLKGGAMEHVNISDFQIALKRNSTFFKNVQLVVVTKATSKQGDRSVDYLEWSITANTDYSTGT